MRPRLPIIEDADGRPGQIGIAVPDLQVALEGWGAEGFGSGGWRVWTYSSTNLRELSYQGARGAWSMTIALCGEHPQIELVEPGEGPSIYHHWLDTRGPGMHHIGFYVPDLDATIRRMEDAGFPAVQAGFGNGADGSGGFAYFDTVATLGYYVEAITPPHTRRPPDRVWPPASD